ncbi:MAG: hypothetical protein U0Y82_16780 [Thermoleophilia bacterium]
MDTFAISSRIMAALAQRPHTERELLQLVGDDAHDLLIGLALSGRITCHPRLDRWELAPDGPTLWAPLAGRIPIPSDT